MKTRVIQNLLTVDRITQHHRAFRITFDKGTMLIVLFDGALTPIYLQSPLCNTEMSDRSSLEYSHFRAKIVLK